MNNSNTHSKLTAILDGCMNLQRLNADQLRKYQTDKGQKYMYPFAMPYHKPYQYLIHLGHLDGGLQIKNIPLLSLTYQMQEAKIQNYMFGYPLPLFQQLPLPLHQVKLEEVNNAVAVVSPKPVTKDGAQKVELVKNRRGRKKTQLHMPDDFLRIQGTLNKIIQFPANNLLDEERIIKKRIRKNKDEKRNQIMKGRDLKETKNIPKNFVKAAITYVLKYPQVVKKILQNQELSEQFLIQLAQKKMIMSNIKQLCNMLTSEVEDPIQKQFNCAFRIIFNTFLKKNAVAYVFNSRITQVNWHLIYRYNLRRAIVSPERFKKVKDI